MKMQEATRYLSFKEFTELCSQVDAKFRGKSTIIALRHGDGSDHQVLGGQVYQKRFTVVKVERGPEYVRVLLDLGIVDEKVEWGWFRVKAESALKKAA